MGQEFCVYDCATARPRGVKAVTAQDQGITVELELKAFDSVLVVFGKERRYLKEVREQTTGILEVKGWTLTALERKVRLDRKHLSSGRSSRNYVISVERDPIKQSLNFHSRIRKRYICSWKVLQILPVYLSMKNQRALYGNVPGN